MPGGSSPDKGRLGGVAFGVGLSRDYEETELEELSGWELVELELSDELEAEEAVSEDEDEETADDELSALETLDELDE